MAENIKRFRVERGFTQNDLAVLLSVSPQAVSRWENGQAYPDINLLPQLAKYLNVSIDELMGCDGQKNENLKKELFRRLQATIDDDSEKEENELRILEIYEELGRSGALYLKRYFQHLMHSEKCGKISSLVLEDRIANARRMMRERMRMESMHERMELLHTVARCEEEAKLELWREEYELPEYLRANPWDEMLLSRYAKDKDTQKLNEQNQKIVYESIENTVYYLTDSTQRTIRRQCEAFSNIQRYKAALDMLGLYSSRADDIFIFSRIVAEVRYAEALLINRQEEESLEMFALAQNHLLLLRDLPNGTVLKGSVSVLDTVFGTLSEDDKLIKCVMRIGGYNDRVYDRIRDDKRFTAFTDSLKEFFPRQECRAWVSEAGQSSALDREWEMLLHKAHQEASTLSDGEAIVMLTAKGNVWSISFPDFESSVNAEGILKFLIELKKKDDTKIERLVCVWKNSGVDMPSYAFREALLSVDRTNLSAKMLLNGLRSYIVKTVRATMPKDYEMSLL